MTRLRRTTAPALAVDLLMVVVFATIGRRNHAEGATVTGVAATAWPFAVGATAGWAAARGWRAPTSVVGTGVGVWVASVAGGMLLRTATGEGTAPSFVVVATVVLGALLLGWRVVVHRGGRRE